MTSAEKIKLYGSSDAPNNYFHDGNYVTTYYNPKNGIITKIVKYNEYVTDDGCVTKNVSPLRGVIEYKCRVSSKSCGFSAENDGLSPIEIRRELVSYDSGAQTSRCDFFHTMGELVMNQPYFSEIINQEMCEDDNAIESSVKRIYRNDAHRIYKVIMNKDSSSLMFDKHQSLMVETITSQNYTFDFDSVPYPNAYVMKKQEMLREYSPDEVATTATLEEVFTQMPYTNSAVKREKYRKRKFEFTNNVVDDAEEYKCFGGKIRKAILVEENNSEKGRKFFINEMNEK